MSNHVAARKTVCLVLMFLGVAGLVACDKPTRVQPDNVVTQLYDDIGFSYSQVPANSAWWLRARFIARSNSVRGIAAGELDKSWVRVSELRQGVIPEDLLTGKEGGLAWNPRFAAEGDFNGDGRLDHALIGVYEDKDGKAGAFLLILTLRSDGKWEKHFVLSFNNPGPIDLTWNGKELTLWFCDYCDNFMSVEWNKDARQYESKTPSFG